MTVLRIRDVRLIVGAVGLSAFGDFLLWIPLALHVEAISGSPLAVSGFFLALFGPVVALGGLGDTLGSPHYAPVYRYRVTRNAEGKARAVYATIDWNKEFALSDPWQYATGVYHFEADLARARATK